MLNDWMSNFWTKHTIIPENQLLPEYQNFDFSGIVVISSYFFPGFPSLFYIQALYCFFFATSILITKISIEGITNTVNMVDTARPPRMTLPSPL